jgi:hypothetical protein
MFDTTIVRHGDSHTHVTEKRAPTDESVRLLREMENTAKKEVLKAVQLPSNDLSGVVHLMRDYMSCSTNVAVLFKLNGKEHKVIISLDDFRHADMDSRIEQMVEQVSKYLAANILEKVFQSNQLREIAAYGIGSKV